MVSREGKTRHHDDIEGDVSHAGTCQGNEMCYQGGCVDDKQTQQYAVMLGLEHQEEDRQDIHEQEKSIQLTDAYLVVIALSPVMDCARQRQRNDEYKGQQL